MTVIDLTPNIRVEHDSAKSRYVVYQNSEKRLYVFSVGMRGKKGEMWHIVDAGYYKLTHLYGNKDTVIARAIEEMRTGEIFRRRDEKQALWRKTRETW